MTDWYKIKKVYVWWPKTIAVSDMQWPCPNGFHVPLTTEWQAIYDVGVSLGAWSSSNGTGISTYLKLPKAWNRGGDSNTAQINTWWMYWSSSPTTNSSYAYNFSFISNLIQPKSSDYYYKWCYVRWIKDYPVVPTSSWTMLYWTSIESWWIFHNVASWLISISSDGSTWYTLMDKNLWATTVYNNGYELTDANCGNVFQWWNNYPFPWTLSYDGITTSSTKVNASTYWPWNYYESSTWITSNPWNSSNNTNLRWWVSQWTSTKTVYPQVRPKE